MLDPLPPTLPVEPTALFRTLAAVFAGLVAWVGYVNLKLPVRPRAILPSPSADDEKPSDEAKAEEPKVEEPKAESAPSEADEAKPEDAKADDAKTEAEDAKTDDAKTDDAKKGDDPDAG